MNKISATIPVSKEILNDHYRDAMSLMVREFYPLLRYIQEYPPVHDVQQVIESRVKEITL